jgi:proline iminopeptidase
LHGGPGADHSYFECFEDFLPQNGIGFYYYDQVDSTNSNKPSDPKLWTIERFRDEVEAVRKGLGLEQFYLLGHSWGGMLAIEYSLAYRENLKGLVISNMAAGTQAYERHLAELRAVLLTPQPAWFQARSLARAGQTINPRPADRDDSKS